MMPNHGLQSFSSLKKLKFLFICNSMSEYQYYYDDESSESGDSEEVFYFVTEDNY
jgi:hypothetical protein